MTENTALVDAIVGNWPVWFVTVTLVVAAVIDGLQLKVPNWITFPMVISGWIYSTAPFGWEGLGWSLVGTVVGLALLMPAYAIGGMGAGDVKLLAMVGAFLGVMAGLEVMLWTFVLAACMALIVLVWRYGLPALIVRSAQFALYKLRLGSAFQLSDQERRPMKTELFLSPSATAAFWIVRLDLASWI